MPRPVHHRCGDQHLSRSRCQARHHPERDRSVHADRPRHAARRDPFRGRNRDLENSLDHRGRGALQDGRPRADHRRHARRPARVRQCHRSGGGPDQGHQVRGRRPGPDPGRARPRSRQHARQESHFLAKADAAGIVLGARVPIILTSRADSVRSRMASCAVAVLYATPAASAALAGGVTTMDTVLVVNAGSSSVKFQVFAVEAQRPETADQGTNRRNRNAAPTARKRRRWNR